MSDRKPVTTERIRDLHRGAYACRWEDGESQTDLTALREKNAAEFDAWLRTVQAEAWERGAMDMANAVAAEQSVTYVAPVNPYEKETPDDH